MGGGDTAMEEALFLAGCAERDVDPSPGRAARVQNHAGARAEHPKIKFLWNTVVTEVQDVKAGTVTGLAQEPEDGETPALPTRACSSPSATYPTRNCSRERSRSTTTATSRPGPARPAPTSKACSQRRRAGPRVPAGGHRRGNRLHGGHRSRALAGHHCIPEAKETGRGRADTRLTSRLLPCGVQEYALSRLPAGAPSRLRPNLGGLPA